MVSRNHNLSNAVLGQLLELTLVGLRITVDVNPNLSPSAHRLRQYRSYLCQSRRPAWQNHLSLLSVFVKLRHHLGVVIDDAIVVLVPNQEAVA